MLSLMLHLHTNAHTHTVCLQVHASISTELLGFRFGLFSCQNLRVIRSHISICARAHVRTCAHTSSDSSVRQCATGQNKTLVSIGTHARAYVCMRVIMFLGHTIYHICFETRSFSNGGRLGGGICMTGSQAVGVYEQLRF